MTWSLVSEDIFECYQLSNEKNIFALLKRNRNTGSFRIESEEKRLFFLQPSLRDRMKFKITNEYGYEAGSFTVLEGQSGSLVVGDKAYLCLSDNNGTTIYNERNAVVLKYGIQDQRSLLHRVAMAFASAWIFTRTAPAYESAFVAPAGTMGAIPANR